MDKDGYHGYDKPVIDESAAKRIATALGWEPKRTWVSLSEDEITQEVGDSQGLRDIIRNIEHKLKEKNT